MSVKCFISLMSCLQLSSSFIGLAHNASGKLPFIWQAGVFTTVFSAKCWCASFCIAGLWCHDLCWSDQSGQD